jgi:biopolymer transport protein ExbB
LDPVTTNTAEAAYQFSLTQSFHDGGSVMYIILVIAVLTVLIVIERFTKIRAMSIDKKEFTDQVYRLVVAGDIRQAISLCDSRPAPLTNTVKAGLIQAMNKRPDEEVQVAMDAAVLREMPKLEGYTSFLAVFGNVAVLAGLLGTIAGMIVSFSAVSSAANDKKAQLLSEGISHALNCTAFGLVVALLGIISYGWFQHRIQKVENEVVETSMTLLNLVVANRDKLRD